MYFSSSLLKTAPQKPQDNMPNCSISPCLNGSKVFSLSASSTATYSLMEFFCNMQFKISSNSLNVPGNSTMEMVGLMIFWLLPLMVISL